MTDDEHYQAAERRWRELANGGVPAIFASQATNMVLASKRTSSRSTVSHRASRRPITT
ncbi:hypothetical protein ACFFWC_03735 [Plantactinospora siamensis]|uniref:Uncharacterized protein n=1 Tax=Plantactinospora siamensis TaxID=555372 RepID=A0ABV6NQR7_9ACTN